MSKLQTWFYQTSLFNKVLKPLVLNYAINEDPRLLQKRNDTYIGVFLLKAHKKIIELNRPLTLIERENIPNEMLELDNDYQDLEEFMQQHLHNQMLKLLQNVHDVEEKCEELLQNVHFQSRKALFAHDRVQAKLIEVHGFSLQVKESNIRNASAGNGVFITCNEGHVIPTGSVVAIMPGDVYLKEFLSADLAKELLPDDNLMITLRLDDILIDSRSSKVPFNPFGQGHYINHPPKDKVPNVHKLPYNCPADGLVEVLFPEHLRDFIPNKYAKKPTLATFDRYSWMHSIVLVSTRPLKSGDELYMDYRLGPEGTKKREKQDWYHPYDPLTCAEAKQLIEDGKCSVINFEDDKLRR